MINSKFFIKFRRIKNGWQVGWHDYSFHAKRKYGQDEGLYIWLFINQGSNSWKINYWEHIDATNQVRASKIRPLRSSISHRFTKELDKSWLKSTPFRTVLPNQIPCNKQWFEIEHPYWIEFQLDMILDLKHAVITYTILTTKDLNFE